MDDKTTGNFGLLVAYVVPGFIILVGLSFDFDPVAGWLIGAGKAGPTVGSFLYVALASVAAGMTASALRWALFDTIHRRTGLPEPDLDESRLPDRLMAFDYIVQHHYRYYQFYSNTCVAILFAYACWRLAPDHPRPGWPEVTVLLLVPVLFAGSRDALRKYYAGGRLLLGTLEKDEAHDQRKAPQHCTAESEDAGRLGETIPGQDAHGHCGKGRAARSAHDQGSDPVRPPDSD